MALTMEQLLMLDNLIYYGKTKKDREYNDVFVKCDNNNTTDIYYDLKKSIKRIKNCADLGKRGYNDFGEATDEFDKVYEDYYMTDDEIAMADKIYKYGNFEGCTIVDATDRDETGFRALTIKDSEDNYYIIFRGTWDKYQWLDDGQGGYMADTESQDEALKYVNAIAEKYKCTDIVVSGHSKGGNLAQYVALMCEDSNIVSKALSYDGQGFSPEFIEMHENEIKQNRHKLYHISAFGDIVNELFIPLTPETHRTYVYAENLIPFFGPVSYHYPNCIFDDNGNIFENTKPSFMGLFIKKFSEHILENCETLEKEVMFYEAMWATAYLVGIFIEKDYKQVYDDTLCEVSKLFDNNKIAGLYSTALDMKEYTLSAIKSFFDQSESNMALLHFAYNDVKKLITFYHNVISVAIDIFQLDSDIVSGTKTAYTAAIYNISPDLIGYFTTLESMISELGAYINEILPTAQSVASTYKEFLETERNSFYSNGFDFYSTLRTNEDKIMTQFGTSGNDIIDGYNFSDDVVHCGNGNDIVYGGDGDDKLYGGSGNDYIYGGKGSDTLYGENGNDILNGGDGNDKLHGAGGTDKLYGGDGDDTLICREGNFFYMDGEDGNDTYIVKADGSHYIIDDCKGYGNSWKGNSLYIQRLHYQTPIYSRDGFDLKIYINNSVITIVNYYIQNPFEEILFQNTDTHTVDEVLDEEISKNVKDYSDYDFHNWVLGTIDVNQEDMASAQKAVKYDPLVLDLNNDGKYTKSLEDGTHFDFSNDGFAEKTGWISEEDGFLVRDVNGDGIINDGSEFFGDKTVLSNGNISTNGFAALADIDSNNDDVINSADRVFNELRVWVDSNGNGLSESEELHTLGELGISQINLKNTLTDYDDENGNTVAREGTFTTVDGNTLAICEIHFNMDTMDTISKQNIDVPDSIRNKMPNLVASGNMYTLHEAMVLDEELYKLVEKFEYCHNSDEREKIIENIVLRWTGIQDIDSSSRGINIDAKHLSVIEKFYGNSFVGTNGANPNNTAANILNKIYGDLVEKISVSLMAQTQIKPLLCLTTIETDEETGKNVINYDTVKSILLDISQDNITLAQDMLYYYVKCISGNKALTDIYSFDELKSCFSNTGSLALGVHLSEISNKIYGNESNDTIRGTSASDAIYGQDGNDSIYGYSGNDVIYGGKGNDYLGGGEGDDTYVFNLGDGYDTVSNYGGSDTIVFGEGISTEDVKINRNSSDLILNISDTDRITVRDFYRGDMYKINKIETSDGYSLTGTQINLLVQAMASFESDTGMAWSDAIAEKNETAYSIISEMWVKAC